MADLTTLSRRLEALEQKFSKGETHAKRLERIEAAMEKAASTPASNVTSPNRLFAEFGPAQAQHSWPMEQLAKHYERLKAAYGGQDVYNADTVVQALAKDGFGRPRGIGWGPALQKMAALADSRCGIQLPSGYTADTLQEHHGFIGAVKAYESGILKAPLAEGSGMTGGYLVPPQFLNQLFTIAAEDAFIEPRSTVIPMTGRTLRIPLLDLTTVQSTGVTPYYGGIAASWIPEAVTIGESEPKFRQDEWVAWDLTLYTLASNQLLMDNAIGLDALLTQMFAGAITWYKEYAFLQGLGAGSRMPMGVLNANCAINVVRSTPGAFTLRDAANMIAHLQMRSWDTACWIMHQSVIPQLIQMTDNSSSNRLVWMNPVMPGNVGPAASRLPQAFLNAMPIFFTEKLPKLADRGSVMLVDWSRYVIGNRLDYQIDVSQHVRFLQNQLAWRLIARCDGRPWLSAPITDANGWTISPIVVLANS